MTGETGEKDNVRHNRQNPFWRYTTDGETRIEIKYDHFGNMTVCIFCIERKLCSTQLRYVSSLSHLDDITSSQIYQHMHRTYRIRTDSAWKFLGDDGYTVCPCRLVVSRKQMPGCGALLMALTCAAPCRLSVQALFKHPESFSTPYWSSLFSPPGSKWAVCNFLSCL